MLAPTQATLPPDPQSARSAREFVSAALRGADPARVDVATLLVSELVTNAVLHAGTSIRIAAQPVWDGLRVEVADESPAPPVPRNADLDALGGRGLTLVDSLADRWGVEPTDRGKVVWFELH